MTQRFDKKIDHQHEGTSNLQNKESGVLSPNSATLIVCISLSQKSKLESGLQPFMTSSDCQFCISKYCLFGLEYLFLNLIFY